MEKLLIEIKNKQGLHLRPATLIFKTLNSYDTVYHFNGQKVFDIQGNKAIGTVYCMTVLIGKNDKGS